MTVYSTSIESTRHSDTVRYLNYMKFLMENDLKTLFHNYLSESTIAYDIFRELKLGSTILYVAIKQLFPGVELLSIYEDINNKKLAALATIATTKEKSEDMLKEFMRITQVKEVMENIEFYKKL